MWRLFLVLLHIALASACGGGSSAGPLADNTELVEVIDEQEPVSGTDGTATEDPVVDDGTSEPESGTDTIVEMTLPEQEPFSGVLAAADYTHFESPTISPLALSPSGGRLFAVNTTAGRLSVFSLQSPLLPELIREIPVGLEPVSVLPVSDDEAWVVNHVSRSISVVSVERGIVVATLPAGNEPADIVLAGSPAHVFVSAARDNALRIYDLANRQLVHVQSIAGEHPRHLAASADGRKVYASLALGGNRTTFIPAWENPYQEPGIEGLPDAPAVGRIVDALDPEFTEVLPFTLLTHDIAELDTDTGTVRYFDRLGTVNFAVAVRPQTEDIYLAGTEANNLTFFLPALRDAFVSNRVSRINTSGGASATIHLDGTQQWFDTPVEERRRLALAQPVDLVFEPSGDYFWLAAFGSDRVARVRHDGVVESRIDLSPAGTHASAKRGPRGLALGTAALYVFNRISSTVQVIDTATLKVSAEVVLGTHDPTPEVIRHGRGFLYDARLSASGTSSCASCHVDAGVDNLGWNLGDPDGNMVYVRDPVSDELFAFHPMKGPMVTQALAGLKGTGPFHWRGDVADLNSFNVLFDKLMGGGRLPDDDMSALSAFIETIALPANPWLHLDGSLPSQVNGYDPTLGLLDFADDGRCGGCHTLPGEPFEFRLATNGRQNPAKVAIPRQAYKKIGYQNVPGAVSTIGFGTAQDGRIAFFIGEDARALAYAWDTGTAPTVGHSITVDSANVAVTETLWQWTTLEQKAIAGRNDLVLHGDVGGAIVAMLYNPADQLYHTCAPEPLSLSREQLENAAANAGTVFTLTGWPPGNARCDRFTGL